MTLYIVYFSTSVLVMNNLLSKSDKNLIIKYYKQKKQSNIEYYCAFVTPKVQMSNSFIEDCKKIIKLKTDNKRH